MGPALIPAAFLLVLAMLAGSAASKPEPPEPGPDPGPLGPDAEHIAALCQALRDRGEAPPLVPNPMADQDLAIRAIKLMGLSGSWPPRASDPQASKDFWAVILSDARRVRAGEIVCEPLADPDPSFDNILDADLFAEACTLWLARSVTSTVDSLALALAKGVFPHLEWPGPPASNRAGFLARTTLLFQALQSGQMSCDPPVIPETVPRANSYYQWRKGDLPFAIVAKAYPQLAGNAPGQAQKRIAAVKMITNHPRNGGGVIGQGIIIKTKLANDVKMLGPAIFSTDPKWYCSPTTEAQRFIPGSCYAVVFLPPI